MPTKKTKEKKADKQSVSTMKSRDLEAETRSNVRKVAEIEKTQRANRTNGEKISELIADFCGSMTFMYVHVAWFAGWILTNSVLMNKGFDPFPYTF